MESGTNEHVFVDTQGGHNSSANVLLLLGEVEQSTLCSERLDFTCPDADSWDDSLALPALSVGWSSLGWQEIK